MKNVTLGADIRSCLFGMVGVLFLGFCYPLCFFRECSGCVMPGKKLF